MQPNKRADQSKHFVQRDVAGFTLLSFLLTQLVWPLSVSAQDTLREEPIKEASGLEEFTQQLQGSSRSEQPRPIYRRDFVKGLTGITVLPWWMTLLSGQAAQERSIRQSSGAQGVSGLWDATGDLREAAMEFLRAAQQRKEGIQLLPRGASDFDWYVMINKGLSQELSSQRDRQAQEKSPPFAPLGYVPDRASWYLRRLSNDGEFRRRFIQLLVALDPTGGRDPDQLLKRLEFPEVQKVIQQETKTAQEMLDVAWEKDPGFFGAFLETPELADEVKSALILYLEGVQAGGAETIKPEQRDVKEIGGIKISLLESLVDWQRLFDLPWFKAYADKRPFKFLKARYDWILPFVFTLQELYFDYYFDAPAPRPFDLKDPVLVRHLLLRLKSRSFVSYQEKLQVQGEDPNKRLEVVLSRLPVLLHLSYNGAYFKELLARYYRKLLKSAGADPALMDAIEKVVLVPQGNFDEFRQALKGLAPELRRNGFFVNPDIYLEQQRERAIVDWRDAFFRILNPKGKDLTLQGQPVLILGEIRGVFHSRYAWTPREGGVGVMVCDDLYRMAQGYLRTSETGRYLLLPMEEGVVVEGEVTAVHLQKVQQEFTRLIQRARQEDPKLEDLASFLRVLAFDTALHETTHGVGILAESPVFLTEAAFGRNPWLTLLVVWRAGFLTLDSPREYVFAAWDLFSAAEGVGSPYADDRLQKVLNRHPERGSLQRAFRRELERKQIKTWTYFTSEAGQKDLEQFGQELDAAVNLIQQRWIPRPKPETVTSVGSTAGLEEVQIAWASSLERWQGLRSASQELGWAVIGEDVASKFQGLPLLAGMEEHVVIAGKDPTDTALYLAEHGVSSVHLFAGLEEANRLTAVFAPLQINAIVHHPGDISFKLFLSQLLTYLGLPQNVISAGLEEFASGLEELGKAA